MNDKQVVHAALYAVLKGLPQACPEITGAVLASREGLVLAAHGDLAGDTAAAVAAHASDQMDRCLALLACSGCSEMLFWSEGTVWYLRRLAGRWALMARARHGCRSGVLRLAVAHAGQSIDAMLAPMAAYCAPA